ncbi:MAG: cupin fold metalloprotein, WbuC family [Rhodocyclales bacterium GT-UBC]|nr:MAG: cupin fold metalloprotein, WbuC family [Rhodocyclales bacterium GT-UBC]
MIQLIDQAMCLALSESARQLPRRRTNRNFHSDNAAPAHRLLVAIEPDSYVVPHCHADAGKAESLLCLRGRLGVVLFSPAGEVERCISLAAGGEVMGIDIPPGVYHSVVALCSDTVFFEAKAGPYVPLAEHEKPAWAPSEGAPEADAFRERLSRLFA